MADQGAFLRRQRFIPCFHKYQSQCCFGFQLIHQPGARYHALLHALRLIRFIAETCEDFSFLPGKYEAGNDRTAIELLAGDQIILDYIMGSGLDYVDLADYFCKEERMWIEKTKRFRFYDKTLYQAI